MEQLYDESYVKARETEGGGHSKVLVSFFRLPHVIKGNLTPMRCLGYDIKSNICEYLACTEARRQPEVQRVPARG